MWCVHAVLGTTKTEQRMNETNVQRDGRMRKKNAHFFPGGHIIADSESASAYAIVVVVVVGAAVVGFIQLASSPPSSHFAYACGTGSKYGRYTKANCSGKKAHTKRTIINEKSEIYIVCEE